jgi:hypothetical protein
LRRANPAESLFGEIQPEIAKAAPADAEELDSVFRRLFHEATTPEKLSHLFGSMRNRLQAIISARGGHTDY